MKKFKQFLRKYKWYRWCEANSVKAHIIFSTIIAQSFWFFNLFNYLDESVIYSLLFSSVLFIGKELADIGDTGFGWKDLFINYLSWGNATLINIFLWSLNNVFK